MNCVYIPRVNISTSEMEVKWHMHAFEIGTVKRVDFSPVGKTPGFKSPEKIVPYKMAFVHFESFYDSADAQLFVSTLTKGQSFTMQFEKHYWMVLPAKNIVPETTMNIHQVVENCRFLEKKLEEQTALIEKQSAFMEKQSAVMENQSVLIQQLRWKDNSSEWNSYKTTKEPDYEEWKADYEWKDPDYADVKMAADEDVKMAADDTFEYPFFEMAGQVEECSVSDTSSDMPSLVEMEDGEHTEKSEIHLSKQFTENFCGNN